MNGERPLFGPRLKLARADRHIRDLESLLDTFICDNPHKIVIEEDPDNGGFSAIADFRVMLPNETATIIGDAVHNLRAALDHLACDMIRASGKDLERVHGFPVYKHKADFDAGIARKLTGAADKFVRFVKDQRPFSDEGGNAWFHDLSRLDNDDKHIVLTPTISVMRVSSLKVLLPNGHEFMTLQDCELGGQGQINLVVGLPPGCQLKSDGDDTLAILFADGSLKGAPVVDTLRQFSRSVGGILKDVATLF